MESINITPPHAIVLKGMARCMPNPTPSDLLLANPRPIGVSQIVVFDPATISFAKFAAELLFAFDKLTPTDPTLVYVAYTFCMPEIQERLAQSPALAGGSWVQFCTAVAVASPDYEGLTQLAYEEVYRTVFRRVANRKASSYEATLTLSRFNAAATVSYVQPAYLSQLYEARESLTVVETEQADFAAMLEDAEQECTAREGQQSALQRKSNTMVRLAEAGREQAIQAHHLLSQLVGQLNELHVTPINLGEHLNVIGSWNDFNAMFTAKYGTIAHEGSTGTDGQTKAEYPVHFS